MSRLRSLQLRALLPLLFVLLVAFWLGLGLLVMPGGQPLFARLLGTVFYAGAMTVFLGVVISRARRGAGGVDELSRMQAAVKAGEVPSDVDSSTWIPMLEKWQDQNRRSKWLAPLMFTGFVALSLWLAGTTGPVWFALDLVFLALLIGTTVSSWRSYDKLTRMLDELRNRAPHAS
jgi:Kef-type K+ transport system membrane component KefB